jgi:uncharacterized membrane protein
MISELLIEPLDSIPREVATMLLAALPVGELRAAIPIAIHVWLIRPLNAFLLSYLGNLLPFFILYFGLDAVLQFLEHRFAKLHQLLHAYVEKSGERVSKKQAAIGFFALALFTGIPFPLTGVYTATAAAVVLRIPFWRAFAAIALGLIISGTIVTVTSLSADVFF